MSTTSTTQPRTRSRWPLLAGTVIVVGALAAYALARSMGATIAQDGQPTFTVRRGPLTISVTEAGTIQSREQVSLKCEVEGQSTLIFLIPEGTRVKAGDLLVELDASQLQDNLVQQQISVDSAEATFVRARESLAAAKIQADSDISKAELDHRFAQEDVSQYKDGQHPQDVMEAESNITLAKEELERAAEKLKWSEQLFKEQYISQTELEADRLSFNRAELNHQLAVASLELLQKYTSQRKIDELESNVGQTAMALDRVKLQANADVVQAEADLKARERELGRQRDKLAKIETQLSMTKIIAPRDGLVVYATSVQGGGRHRMSEPLQEGQAVRERQELIYLPSADSMMAQVLIHESSLEKVQVGQTVRLKVDALPEEVYTGRVAKIAPLPDAQSAWMNPDLKVYPTEIHLDGVHPELRTGMSCQAEIIVEQYPNALYIPVQAVTRIGSAATVYVREGKNFQPRTIDIGFDNNAMVYVRDGLEPGEVVSLTPPLDTGDKHATESESDQPTNETPAADAPTASGPPTDTPPTSATPAPQTNQEEAAPAGPGDDWAQMSDDERRQRMRERFEKMTPEERQAAMERMRQQDGMPGGRGGQGRPPGSQGGQPGGGSNRDEGGE